MANVYDYLKWRGDLTFEKDPLNGIDAVIFSILCYVEMDELFAEKESWTVEEAGNRYFELHEYNEKKDGKQFLERVPYFMKECSLYTRFKDIRMDSYVDIIDEQTDIQMAAVVFRLPGDCCIVAYRGTDHTIIGWKEDFKISVGTTNGQKACSDYLNEIYAKGLLNETNVIIAGHSKGGNYANYAAAFADPGLQESITEIYCLDSPGAHDDLRKGSEYQGVQDKVVKFVPEQSIIGMIFDDGNEDLVLESDATGILQHDPFSWQLLGKEFVRVEKLSDFSFYCKDLFRNWLAKLDDETRDSFVDAFFSIPQGTGAATFKELYSNIPQGLSRLWPVIKDLDEDQKRSISRVFRAFIESAIQKDNKKEDQI